MKMASLLGLLTRWDGNTRTGVGEMKTEAVCSICRPAGNLYEVKEVHESDSSHMTRLAQASE